MDLKNMVKKIWFSLYDSGRVVLLDYRVSPKALYTEANKNPHSRLFNLLAVNRSTYQQILKTTLNYEDAFSVMVEDKMVKNDIEPGWNNNYLPGLDIIMLYSLLSEIKPSKYLEIGSG